MSKRSSRIKRKEKEKKQIARLSGPELVKQGDEAFKQANYNEAIRVWEQSRAKGNIPPNLPTALAEAYFRRAVNDSPINIVDLRQAVKLRPADLCYSYHVGLAYHRRGELAEAESIYRQLLTKPTPFKRAAMPLAQLLIEQKKPLQKDLVWNHLSEAEQVELAGVESVVKGEPNSLRQYLAKGSLSPLWHGLVALSLDDQKTAQQSLQAAITSNDKFSAEACGVAHYYLGILASKSNQVEQAQKYFQTAKANGFDTPHLKQNMSNLAYLSAVREKQAGHSQRAVELLNQVESMNGVNEDLLDLQEHLNWDLGYAAAQKNDWKQALHYWEMVKDNLGKSRALTLNLALAYQNVGKHAESAKYWRELLRRRPRNASHPDALTDEKVARIWQNVADNYAKSGDFEEAIKTYKNAIKWAPDNLELRFKLVDVLETEGRWQAAENELDRILAKSPDNIRALTMLGEIYAEDSFLQNRAQDIWLRILKLEPQNPIARQQLVYSYEKKAHLYIQWRQYKNALKVYEEGLQHLPNSQRLCAGIGMVYADLKEFDKTRQYFERALAIDPNDLQTLFLMFVVWLDYKSASDVDKTFERIKAVRETIPSGFFIDLIDRCIEVGEVERAKAIGKFIEERYTKDEKTLVGLAEQYKELNQKEQAMNLLRHVLKNNPSHAEANMNLGTLYYESGQTRLGKQHWQNAEIQARKDDNQVLLYQLKITRDALLYGKPLAKNPLQMLKGIPPELMEMVLRNAPPEMAAMLKKLGPEAFVSLLEDLNNGSFGFDDEDD